MSNVSDDIIEGILPAYSLNILYGPTGAGKTPLALQLAAAVSTGAEWFGYATRQTRLCYVACDRAERFTIALIRKLGLDPALAPHIALADLRKEDAFERVLEAALRRVPSLKFLIIDTLHALFPGNPNLDRDVIDFMRRAQRLCGRDLTILGLLRGIKQRYDGYASPRDRVLGSSAWLGSSETKLILEMQGASKLDDPRRVLYVAPQLAPPDTHYLLRDPQTSGLIVNANLAANGQAGTAKTISLDAWLTGIGPEDAPDEFGTSDAIAFGEANGISHATTERWLRACVEALGTLTKTHGRYFRAFPRVIH